MSKHSLDNGWKFHNGDIPFPVINSHTKTYMAAKAGGAIGAASPDFDKSGWEDVDLPHDFAVRNEFDEAQGPARGYKARGKAWYSKRFLLDAADRDKQILIEFEGVAGECVVWLNGSVIGRNFSGYNSFAFDATDMALYGDSINELVVYVNSDLIEGWWYEGAGIYRHVNLYKKDRLHFEHNGIFLEPVKLDASTWQVFAHISVENINTTDEEFEILVRLYDEDGNIIGSAENDFKAYCGDTQNCELSFLTYSPVLWDIDSPVLYKATAELKQFCRTIDKEEINIGFRTIAIDAENGFYLNGRNIKLYGVCCHQDHAGVGIAVPDGVNEYRIKLLKEMGANAYRAAHGNASKAILDACDKYGILLMDENRQYNTAETDGLRQVRDMVTRDRNHPSVIMYSLYNEEPMQGTYTGRKLAQRLRMTAEKYDGTRFTLGANNTGLLSKDGAYDVCDVTGINYQTHLYDEFCAAFPHLPVTGSENCSAFMTRGCYKTDHSRNVIDMFDSECADWGNTYRDGFRQINGRKNFMGYFVWTGFDYRGEPTPFEYPSISTQFGIMDTCGFPKSAYYLNRSYWTKERIVHIVSHWNYKEGEKVRLVVFSNCGELRLIINGRECGRTVSDSENYAEFEAVSEPGYVRVEAADGTASDTVYTASETAALRLCAGMGEVYENDAVCINVYAEDRDGHFVYNADSEIRFSVRGGRIIGVGNGDPNSHEADAADHRKLFAGCCQAIAAPDGGAKELIVTAETDSGITASVTVPVRTRADAPKAIPSVKERYISKWRKTLELSPAYPEYDKEISDSDMNTWVIATVGDGYDELFKGKTGFGMYKQTADIHKSERLTFCELFGDNVDVYINGERVFSGRCVPGQRFEYIAPEDKTLDITIVIESITTAEQGGIPRPVIITTEA